jgi:hypothetical protein
MRKRHVHRLFWLGLAALAGEIYLCVSFPAIGKSIGFMLWLIVSANAVGAIPRKARSRPAQIFCWVIGWPMLLVFMGLMAFCVGYEFTLDAPTLDIPELLLLGFLWVLTLLTWKIFIKPTVERSDAH